MEYTHIIHPFPALYDEYSRVLILGSLPSVKSREQMFFYGHPQNRFWRVMAALLDAPVPATTEEKSRLILSNRLALWDTIYSCDIIGSSDASIKNVVPTDLSSVLAGSRIEHIFCNGKTSWKYFRLHQEKTLGMKAATLPSTSPANAACSLPKLIQAWGEALLPCLQDDARGE